MVYKRMLPVLRPVLAFCLLLSFSLAKSQSGYPASLTVALDGSGDYTSIQQAINAFRAYSPVPLRLFIKNGTYHEKIVVHSWVTNITIVGQSKDSTIIAYNDYSGKYMAKGADTINNKTKHTTFTTYTMWVQGNDVRIENLTIANTSGRVGQAVALHVDGDRFVLKDCRLLGNQDTLLTANDATRQYYYNCYIEGTTDFIFGPATAVFQNCVIRSLTNSYITAASTSSGQAYGYVFLNCRLEASEEAKKVFLGRPWRANARTVFIGCQMGGHILPEGWHNWGNAANEQTAYYAEYGNTGPGANTEKRVAWGKRLTKKEASGYTLSNIFKGWSPGL